jgi:hypothetical protein
VTTRLILGACMLAHVAHAQLAAKPSLATPTTLRETETGSWRAGDAMVWIRVAPTGAISVYASHGYRSAFAHAVIITPEDADKWADLGDHVLAGQTASGAIMLGDSDIALEPMRAGDSVALAVRLGGVRPDGITFLMNGQSLREVLPILRATAKQSRATQSASASPPPATPATPAAAPAPVTVTPATAAPAAAHPTTPAAAPVATPHTAVIDSPPPAVPVALASAPAAPAAPPEVAAADTPPAPAPEAEVAPATSTPAVAAAPVAPTPAPTPIVPAPVAPAKIAKVTKPKPAPQAAETAPLRHTSAGSIAKPAAAMTITVGPTDATKLAPSTVANLVKQWQSQLDLCYSEFGLKVNPALTGSIAVRLAIRTTGDVGAATFVHHRWSGAGGTEAESCMRARVMAWMFPPASTPSAHEFTVAFAP